MAADIKNAELNEKLMEFHSIILELQGKLSELVDENATLNRKVTDLCEQAAIRKKLVFDENSGHYWSGSGQGREGPFCKRCFDVDGIAVRMSRAANGGVFCEECNIRKIAAQKR